MLGVKRLFQALHAIKSAELKKKERRMKPVVVAYASLFGAIVCETIATSFLKESEQFTRLVPSLITVAGYVCAFYLLSICLKTMPVGIAYAIWSGLGIVLISIIGALAFGQHLDLAAWIGIGLIIAGVLVVNLFSSSVPH